MPQAHPTSRKDTAIMGMRPHLATLLTAILTAPAMFGCAPGGQLSSNSPVFASSFYGDGTQDGAMLTLPLSEAEAVEVVNQELRSAGYNVQQSTNRDEHIATRVIADTVMTVVVKAAELEGRPVESIVVLTAKYRVGAEGGRDF